MARTFALILPHIYGINPLFNLRNAHFRKLLTNVIPESAISGAVVAISYARRKCGIGRAQV
jgi:hypothetical protein